MRSLALLASLLFVVLPRIARAQDASILAADAGAPAPQVADAGAEPPPSTEEKVAAAPSAEPAPAEAKPAAEAKVEEPERDPEHEAPQVEAAASDGTVLPGKRYTADLTDEELEKRWKEEPS